MNNNYLYSGFGATPPPMPPHMQGAGWKDWYEKAKNEVTNPDSVLRSKYIPLAKRGLQMAANSDSQYAGHAGQALGAMQKVGLGRVRGGRGGVRGGRGGVRGGARLVHGGRAAVRGGRAGVRGAGWNEFADAFKHGPDHFFSRARNEVVNPHSDLREKVIPVAAQALNYVPGMQAVSSGLTAANKIGRGQGVRGGSYKRYGPTYMR